MRGDMLYSRPPGTACNRGHTANDGITITARGVDGEYRLGDGMRSTALYGTRWAALLAAILTTSLIASACSLAAPSQRADSDEWTVAVSEDIVGLEPLRTSGGSV